MSTTNQQILALGGHTSEMNEEDILSFSKAEQRIIELMSDEKWHSAGQIISASGQREGLRRLRALRQRNYQIDIRRVKVGGVRSFDYKLTKL
jgi:hypothetical protein